MKRSLFAALLCVCMVAVGAWAQVGYGEISGYMYDEDHAAIPGVELTVTSPAMLGDRNIASNQTGRYRVINLPPGIYMVVAKKEGYRTVEMKNIEVRAGKTSSLNITLPVGEFAETITIVHEVPLIDLKSTERSINIDGEFINRLPLSSNRDWDTIWSLVPGVYNVGLYTGEENEARVHGADGAQNVFRMEGMDIGGSYFNYADVYIPPEAIKDVRIITGGFDASIGAGAGGYINIVMRSGGNDFHGSGSLIFQPKSWNDNNVEGGVPQRIEMFIPNVTLGGPIVRDRTWFFSSYRYDYRNEENPFTAREVDYIRSLGLEPFNKDKEHRKHRFLGKLTHALTDTQRLEAMVSYDRGVINNIAGWALTATNGGANEFSGGPFITLGHEGIWNDNFSTTMKIAYRSPRNEHEGMNGLEPYITRYPDVQVIEYMPGMTFISGRGEKVDYNNYPQGEPKSVVFDETIELRADVKYYIDDLWGGHDLNFGINMLPYRKYKTTNVSGQTLRIYETLNDDGEWVPFQREDAILTELAEREYSHKRYAAYLQDTWTQNDRLTLSYGLRIEHQGDDLFLGSTSFSPHVGFNYALTGDQKSSVRVYYGIRENVLSGFYSTNAYTLGSAGSIMYYDYNLDGTWDSVMRMEPRLPGSTAEEGMTQWSGAMVYADDFRQPYTHELQLGFTRVLPLNLTFDASYVYHLSKADLTYYDVGAIWENGEFVGIRDDIEAQIIRMNDKWTSKHFQSLEFSVSKAFSEGWQLMASYTWQSSVHKGSWRPDEMEYYLYPADWFEYPDEGLVAHMLRFAGSFTLPYEFKLTTSFNWQSGRNAYPYWSRDLPPDLTFTPYIFLPDGSVVMHPFTRNPNYLTAPRSEVPFKTDPAWFINLGLGKDFKIRDKRIEVQLQIFNLFNNGTEMYPIYSASETDWAGNPLNEPYYKTPQAPRVLQLLVKYVF